MNPAKATSITKAMKKVASEIQDLSINEIRVIVALERAIARLSSHKNLTDHLIFKGGFVLLKYFESKRFTRDADALATRISKNDLESLIIEALSTDLDDGLWYGDIKVEDLAEQGGYGAFRFNFAFQIGQPEEAKVHKLSRIHIDVGFSDRLPTFPHSQQMPTLISYDSPISWKIYPIEYILAEKIQTLFDRGSANSRAKDVYDIVFLYPKCQDMGLVKSAIRHTFENRGTKVPSGWLKDARRFDYSIMKGSWPGIQLFGSKEPFNTTLEVLFGILSEFDRNEI